MIGGASREGPLAEVWHLDVDADVDSSGSVPCRWRELPPLDAGRVWHTAVYMAKLPQEVRFLPPFPRCQQPSCLDRMSA